jgi:hypothetical protein
VPLEAVPELRRQQGPPDCPPLPPAFLKHADEQTLAVLAAVYGAIRTYNLAGPFRDWGVLAAPRFLGRAATVTVLQRFADEGAWGISPHQIPHRSLHSLSGTISQALKIHGPNFGVGGGPGCETEVLLAALALLQGRCLPGVWVVLSRPDPELPPGADGTHAPGTHFLALALALVPAGAAPSAGGTRVRLTVEVPRPGRERSSEVSFALPDLVGLLRRAEAGEAPLVASLGAGVCLELCSPVGRGLGLVPGPGAAGRPTPSPLFLPPGERGEGTRRSA